jgi:hypothetical protein
MRINSHTQQTRSPNSEAIDAVLREARKLHRAAISESLARSLPILRRILSSGSLQGVALPALHRQRNTVQRKHVLRTLAVEAGFPSLETYRPALAGKTAAQLEHFDMVQRAQGYPNTWFSTHAEALEYAAQHGGRTLRVGRQAVVFPGALPIA